MRTNERGERKIERTRRIGRVSGSKKRVDINRRVNDFDINRLNEYVCPLLTDGSLK